MAVVRSYQSLSLTASTPVQLVATGVYDLAILNTGPGNLYVSTGSSPGVNAQSMLIPSLKTAPLTTTAGSIWISSDQDGGVSIAAMPR